MRIRIWIGLLLVLSLAFAVAEKGSNYETTCVNGVCTSTIYSNLKYVEDSKGEWQEVVENFGSLQCDNGYDYCSEEDKSYYKHNIVDGVFSDNSIDYNGEKYLFQLKEIKVGEITILNLEDANPLTDFVVDKNMITYKFGSNMYNVYNLPNSIYDEFILNQYVNSLSSDDLELFYEVEGDFSLNGDAMGRIGDVYVFNKDDNLLYSASLEEYSDNAGRKTLRVVIPNEVLLEENFPLTIDPTLTFDDTAAVDVYVWKDTSGSDNHQRSDTNKVIVGRDNSCPSISFNLNRGVYEFNLSSVHDYNDITITDMKVELTVKTEPGNDSKKNMSVHSMQNYATNLYPDNASGNLDLWEDAGNSTVIGWINLSDGSLKVPTEYDLDYSSDSMLQSAINNPNTLYSIGLTNLDEGTTCGVTTRFYSSEAVNSSRRPSITITYNMSGANESEGDDAIEQGILNVLPDAIIKDEQQVNIDFAGPGREIGRFDKYVINGSKRWGFNYVTEGENFTNMNNLSTVYYVMEMEDMLAEDITSAVEDFITSTS